MLLTLAFWLVILADLAALGLVFLLGLAAGPPSHTGPIAVAGAILVVPGLLIMAAVALFHFAPVWPLRLLAFGVAAAPLLVVALAPVVAGYRIGQFRDGSGAPTKFRSDGMQALEKAIARGDATTVATLARDANLRERSIEGTSVVVVALRHLQKHPGSPDVVRALLAAGASADDGGTEPPLVEAIRVGPEAVRVLLDAGADPDALGPFGAPVWWGATGRRIHPDILPLLLDRGADVNARARDGRTALFDAVNAQNWPAVTVLLDHGVDWRAYRDLQGRDLRARLEADQRLDFVDKAAVAGVLARLR
ncbi:hypothetical protein TBR22_A40020 [Luteitalea sp. TBR-22]|uniref:ankyrin repeat domain-containing protein n=1 Tax=Luteitalea sp. TBR-22 TaxID=2802971 RepID=UPI001AF56933|nr:hypothetical protein [Luteitalea sp. TBR-22]BCS34776.1 hypothetical protein TBR22_A40020 [Luteitalea sp. TBR-22]